MNTRIAKGISLILHPIFIPTYIILGLYFLAPLSLFYAFLGKKIFYSLLILVFIYTAIVPSLFAYLLYRTKQITTLTVANRKERPKVLLLTSGFFIALAYFLYLRGNVFSPTAIIIFSMAVNIWGLFIISFFDKISAHMSALAGALGIFFGLYYWLNEQKTLWAILILLLLMGITASARLYLGAHNLRQVIIGALWGFVVGFGAIYFFMFI